MTIDAVVDERALREIYLAGYEIAIKEAQPWTLMGAYNRLNGTYACEHPELLRKILKEEWGHEGLVMTDWGLILSCQRYDGLAQQNEGCLVVTSRRAVLVTVQASAFGALNRTLQVQ